MITPKVYRGRGLPHAYRHGAVPRDNAKPAAWLPAQDVKEWNTVQVS